MEQLVRILLTTLNYKTLRKEKKRRNSGHQEVKKTAKTSFLFLLPNSQSDNLFNLKLFVMAPISETPQRAFMLFGCQL